MLDVLPISKLINLAFLNSRVKHKEIEETWINLSCKFGGFLPESLLMLSIQKTGQLDMLLRCLEDEFINRDGSNEDVFSLNNQCLLSDLWIEHTYEIFRILKNHREIEPRDEIESIEKHLRLIRVPLSKHQIAADYSLKDSLILQKHPKKNDDTDFYEYKYENKKRSHIMPRACSERGSMMWHVIDIKSGPSFWIERRNLSDRILNLIEKDNS